MADTPGSAPIQLTIDFRELITRLCDGCATLALEMLLAAEPDPVTRLFVARALRGPAATSAGNNGA